MFPHISRELIEQTTINRLLLWNFLHLYPLSPILGILILENEVTEKYIIINEIEE